MKKYLCLIYQDVTIVQNLSREAFEKIHRYYIALAAQVKNSGRLRSACASLPIKAQ